MHIDCIVLKCVWAFDPNSHASDHNFRSWLGICAFLSPFNMHSSQHHRKTSTHFIAYTLLPTHLLPTHLLPTRYRLHVYCLHVNYLHALLHCHRAKKSTTYAHINFRKVAMLASRFYVGSFLLPRVLYHLNSALSPQNGVQFLFS